MGDSIIRVLRIIQVALINRLILSQTYRHSLQFQLKLLIHDQKAHKKLE